jgi:DNA adenine methylase
MVNKSPLRYPGGKTRAIKTLEKYVDTHFPNETMIVSPFFGGGSFELYMADKGYTIHANDLFLPLYTFWKTIQVNCDDVSKLVRSLMPVDKAKFHELRSNILEVKSDIETAAYYYVINRCSFSGSTFCGGFSAQASTGRLNDLSLKTLETVNLKNIHISNYDCIEFLRQHSDNLIYADPPYYISTYIYGRDGDLHKQFDHESFANEIKKHPKWILSYNDCEYIRNLYSDCRIYEESWSYGMNSTKKSSEIVILPAES